MNCNCMWTEVVLLALVLVFTIWPTLIFSAIVSFWIVVVSAVILLIHAVKPNLVHYSSTKAKGGSRRKKRR